MGAGGGTFDTNGNTITFATGLTGSGGLAKQGLGTLNLTGNNTYTGGTAVLAGTLAINGSIAGNVAVGSAGTLGGNGTIAGSVVNAGTLAPGNSIGLLTVNGSYTQMAGSTYQVEVNNAGQGDRINVGGAAAIQGGTVQVLAAAGSYANSTTYTIVRATGGVSGAYAGVSSNFAFLDADTELRCQRRLPHPGAAGAERLHADLPGARRPTRRRWAPPSTSPSPTPPATSPR